MAQDTERPITLEDLGDAARQRREPTITADVAQIRAAAARAFSDRDKDLPSDHVSTGQPLATAIAQNHPDRDADALRVLAARIARAGVTGNEDPLCTLTDVAAALVSLTAVVASLAGPELGDDDGPEAFKIYAETIDHLRNAADGVVEMAGWF